MSNTIASTNKNLVASFTDPIANKTYDFPFNINGVEWQYQMNNQSFDTIGGRVTQLLSVKISTMSLQGDAGSRNGLIQLYTNFKNMQDNQNIRQTSMGLYIPIVTLTETTSLKFSVWLTQMQIGWDPTTSTYPYQMQLEVDQDFTGLASGASTANALDKISADVGFSPFWNGLSTSIASMTASQVQLYVQALQAGSGGSTS